MEMQFKTKKKRAILRKQEVERYYKNYFFSTFMNSFETNLNPQEERFLLTQMWTKGTINAFILDGTKPTNIDTSNVKEKEGLLILTPYASQEYNIYNYPTKITAVALRGASFIPQEPMEVNKDCVIIWGHKSHMPIEYLVDFYVDKIADVEMTISTNLFVHKLPRLVVCSMEDKKRVAELMNAIENGEEQLFLDVNDWQAIKNVLETGASYIIDKLQLYKEELINECLTVLGVDNKGSDKKERLLLDEVNANNDIINIGNSCFLDEMKIGFEQITNILGHKATIKAKQSPVVSEREITKDGGGEDDEDDNI